MNKLLRKVLLVAFAVCMALGVTLAACGPETETVTYSVTVTCEDTTVLTGVSVALAQNGENKDKKALEGGKATFELPAGSYDVVLSGVADGYVYSPATVTAEKPDVTVALTLSTQTQTVTYTVNASCENGELPGGITAQLQKEGETVFSKSLTDGTATFEAEAGTYTALLMGVPSGYDFVSEATKTLTATERTADFVLKRQITAVDCAIVLNLSSDKDVFGAPAEPSALAGATVELFASEDAVKADATAVSGLDGKAQFQGIKPGTYYIHVNGLDQGTVTVPETGAETVKDLTILKGTKDAPLSWQLGANSVPLTADVLAWLNEHETKTKRQGDGFVYFTFSVEEGGAYSFDSDNTNANVTGEAFSADLYGERRHVLAQLEAGKVYTFACSAAAVDDAGDGSYTVTITKGNTDEGGGDTPTVPWEGEGTQSNPYIITKLKDQYKVSLKYENGDYVPVYFKYVETTGAKYAIYSSDEAFLLTVGNAHYGGGGNSASSASLFQTADGGEYLFAVSADSESEADIVVTFTIGDFTGWTAKWKGSGEFQAAQPEFGVAGKDDPYLVETLVDDYVVECNINRVYFKYTATETKNYKVCLTKLPAADGETAPDPVPLNLWLRVYNSGKADSGTHYTINNGTPEISITLTAGTTYLLGFTGDDGNTEPHTMTLSFKIEEGEAVVDPAKPDGSEDHPFTLDPVLGDHDDIETTNDPKNNLNGVWYTFTATEDAVYTFTLKTDGWLQVGAKNLFGKGKTLDLSVTTGATYTVCVLPFGSATTATVSFSVTKKSNEPDGSKDRPFVLEGEFLGDHSIPVDKTVYYKYTLTEDMTVTVTSKGAMTLVIGGKSLIASGAGKSVTVDLKAGEIVLKFEKSTSATADFTVEKVVEPDGSEENPFPLDGEFLGEHTVATPAELNKFYYYKTTISEDMTVIVTSGGPLMFYIGTSVLMAGASGVAKEYVLPKGDVVIRIARSAFGGDEAKFTIAKKVESAPLPDEFKGTWKSLDGKYEMTIDNDGALTLKKDGAAVETLVTSATGAMEGGSFYYVTVEGKKYQLRWDSVGKNALELYAEVETSVGEYIYFAPDPLPTFSLGEFAGEYTERAEKQDSIVVTESAISWQGHTILLVGDVTASYPGYTKAWAAYVDGKPETVGLLNGSFYFMHAQLYFDSAIETVELPETFVGKWKSLDGSYLLDIADTKTLTLTVSGAEKQFTLSSEKDRIETHYYLTVDGTQWELAISPAGPGTLMLASGSGMVYFTPDPIPAVTFGDEIGTYTLVDEMDDPAEGAFVISEHEITWTGHTVIVANVLQSNPDLGQGYPLFIDGNPYQLVNFYGLMLIDTVEGTMYTLEEDKIEGSGTQADPEILKNLDQTITRYAGIDISGRYYFRFTPEKNAILTITAQTACSVGGKLVNGSTTLLAVGGTVSAQVQSGTTYDFWIQANQKTGAGDVTIVLSTADAPEVPDIPDIPWSGSGTKSSPYVLTEIGDEITVYIAAGGLVDFSYTTDTTTLLQFTLISNGYIGLRDSMKWKTGGGSSLNSTARKTDTVSVNGTLKFYVQTSNALTPPEGIVTFKIEQAVVTENYTVTVKGADKDVYGNTLNEAPKSGVDVSLMNGEQVVETKQTGADGTVTFTQPKGDYTVKIGEDTYTFTENAATVTILSDVVFGTLEHPLPLKLGENTVSITREIANAGGVEYSFTVNSNASYVFSGIGTGHWFNVFTDNEKYEFKTVGGFSSLPAVTLELSAGTTYRVQALNTGATFEPYIIKIEVVPGTAEAVPDEGFQFNEQFIGTWKSEDGYTISITATTFLLTEPNGVKADYTISEGEPDRYQERTYTVVWNGVTYTFQNLDDPITLTLASASGSKSFELTATEGFTVDFPEEMQGSWKCQGSEDDDEDVSNIPNLVVGLNSVTWAGHDVKVIGLTSDGLTTVYILDIDGGKWFLQLSKGELNTTLELSRFKTEEGYTFANTGAQGGETEDKVTYTVTVNLTDTDVFGGTLNQRTGANLEIELYNGDDLVGTYQTDGNGVWTASLVQSDSYTLKVYGNSYPIKDTTATVTAVTDIVFGTQEHPISIQAGETQVTIPESLAEIGVYYAFVPEEDGTYTFSGIGATHWFSVQGKGVAQDTVGGRGGRPAFQKELTGGEIYTVTAYSLSPYTAYTIKIELELWDGEGEKNNPIELSDPFAKNIEVKDVTNTNHKYYTFTLGEDVTVKVSLVSGSDDTYYVKLGGANAVRLTSEGTEAKLQAGKIVMEVYSLNTVASDCTIKIEKVEQSGDTGTADHPETVTALEGEWKKTVTSGTKPENGYYIQFTPTETAYYTFSTADTMETVKFGTKDTEFSKLTSFTLTSSGPAYAKLESGTTYILVLFAATGKTETNITITKSAEPDYSDLQGDGTQTSPYVLTGDRTIDLFTTSRTSVLYFRYTATGDVTLNFTALMKTKTTIIGGAEKWDDGSAAAWSYSTKSGASQRSITLHAGTTLDFSIAPTSATATMPTHAGLTVSITASDESKPDLEVVALPEELPVSGKHM